MITVIILSIISVLLVLCRFYESWILTTRDLFIVLLRTFSLFRLLPIDLVK